MVSMGGRLSEASVSDCGSGTTDVESGAAITVRPHPRAIKRKKACVRVMVRFLIREAIRT